MTALFFADGAWGGVSRGSEEPDLEVVDGNEGMEEGVSGSMRVVSEESQDMCLVLGGMKSSSSSSSSMGK